MPRANRTVLVQRIKGEPFRYRVESWDDPTHPHLVDGLEHDGNGECDCWDFRKKCMENLTKHCGKIIAYGRPEKPNPERTQCRHIDAAIKMEIPHLYRGFAREQRAKRTHFSQPTSTH